MLFNSLVFIIFLILTSFLYYLVPQKYKWVVLLIASYIFYASWRFEFIFLILFSTIFNYFIAKFIYSKNSKKILIFGILINFLILFIFKYMMFVKHTFESLYNYFGIDYNLKQFDIILPMGISFYTFQAVSYIIDIYRKDYLPEKNYFKFSLYIMFFPQLVAGPIERADKLLNQFFTKKYFEPSNIFLGIQIMIIGFFKKIVIADRVAVLVNMVYNSPRDYTGISFIIATLFFTFQIYCDFSGYSDIAIGCAKIFDIDLMQNFKSPYFSKSIKEFWSRWHISLSTWFRDYLYIPLGGSRCKFSRLNFNILVTFLVSGLWHGANWTFVLWGSIHGLYQIIANLKNRFIKNKNFNIKSKSVIGFFNLIRMAYIFLIVNLAWIFFRANSISDAIYIFKNLLNDIENIFNIQYMYNIFNSLGLNIFEILISVFSILILVFIELFEKNSRIYIQLLNKNSFIRISFYYILVVIILSLGVFTNAGQFIYFQF